MARQADLGEAPKKKKQGFVKRMMFGDENKPDLTPERMKMTKWEMFKYLFFSRFGTMVALNLLTLIFALPGAAVIVLFTLNKTVANGFVPYSSNFGFGYPVVTDAVHIGTLMNFNYDLFEFLLLIPCIMIFALGVSGNLYVIRRLMWEQPTSTIKDFFRGIGKCWLCALVMGLVFGLTLLIFRFSLGYFDAFNQPTSLKVLCIVLSSILLFFIILITAFVMTQNAAFKMGPMVLLRNSLLFVLGTNIQAVFFIGIAIAPVFLVFVPGITFLLVLLYVFIGFSFTTLVTSLFCHYCYEKFLYDKIEGAPAVYTKRTADETMEGEPRKKREPVPFKNPKKRKKSIDEGADITPLTPMFRREDLERLEKEHEQVLSESDDADISDADDMTDETSDAPGEVDE